MNKKNKFKFNKIINVIGVYSNDCEYMEEILAKNYAKRNNFSTLLMFENGKYIKTIIVGD